jgi:hypothetical protein
LRETESSKRLYVLRALPHERTLGPC